MSMLSRLLKKSATFWPETTRDQYGDASFSAPVAIKVHWEDKIELFTDKKGEQIQSHAIIWTESALTVGGYLYLGTSVASNPESVTGSDMVRRVDFVEGIDQRDQLFKAYL